MTTAKKTTTTKAKAAPKKITKPKVSNKGKIFLAWKKGETDSSKLFKLVNEEVKQKTIVAWARSWKNNKCLPAIAKQK